MPDGGSFPQVIGTVAKRLMGDPNPDLSSRETWRYGTHGSLAVEVAGEKAGTWFDHETKTGGGVVDLLKRELRLGAGEIAEWLEREVGMAPLPEAPRPFGIGSGAEPPRGRIVAAYDYFDADGALAFQVVRMAPKDFRQRRPDGAGGWVWKMKGVALVPYRLPDLMAAPPNAPVFVVEGEKDADALHALGLVATCNPGGAGKWQPEFGQWLRGRDVVVLPDNDDAGEAHARDVAAKLAGAAASIRVISLPDLPAKGDVSDWLAAGGTREALARLVEAPPPPAPQATDTDLPLIWFDEITPVLEARDFVQGVLAEQSAVVVYGESNAGKTFWTTDLALHVAAGKEWNGRRVDGGGVIYCALEGGIGFRNRVAAWRTAHVKPGDQIHFAAVAAGINLLDPEADTQRLIRTIKAAAERMAQPVKLVVIDTLSRALAGGNENAPEDMGALVRNMDAIREATGAALLFVHHSGKDAAKGARGHSLLRAAIDTEIEVKADETTGSKTATAVKQREMKKGDVFGFRLETKLLGRNQHGEDVTTCIVEPEEVRRPTTSGQKPITVTERGWLADLTDLFAGDGAAVERAPASGMTPCLTLTREQVRAGFRAKGRFTCGPDGNLTGSDRERMRAALVSLKDKGKIGLTAELVWLV